MNSVLRRSHLGGARQLVCNHEQTGAVAPSENGRRPPALAHQLASAREFMVRFSPDGKTLATIGNTPGATQLRLWAAAGDDAVPAERPSV